jgi:hypothetical protein
MFQHQVGQRPVDQLRHDLRLGHLGQSAPKAAARAAGSGPLVGRFSRAGGIRLAMTSPAVCKRGRVTASAATRSTRRLFRCRSPAPHPGSRPGLGQLTRHVQQGVIRLFRLHLLAGKVGGGHVGPGVAVKADGAQVQKCGLAPFAHEFRRLLRHGESVKDIQPVCLEIGKTGAGGKPRLDPALGRLGGNADAVVFAHEQQGQRDRLIGRPSGGIERALCGGMVGRCIAKAAHHKRIVGKLRMFGAMASRGTDGIGRPHRLGQVAGDG